MRAQCFNLAGVGSEMGKKYDGTIRDGSTDIGPWFPEHS